MAGGKRSLRYCRCYVASGSFNGCLPTAALFQPFSVPNSTRLNAAHMQVWVTHGRDRINILSKALLELKAQ